jgi:hypothetical protein
MSGCDEDYLRQDAVFIIREMAKEGLGFNAAFVDDDMRVLVGLAQRAVLAGLDSDMKESTQTRMRKAAEECRAAHEASLGRPITKV